MCAGRSIIRCHWPRLCNNLRESELAPSVAEDTPLLLRNDSPIVTVVQVSQAIFPEYLKFPQPEVAELFT